MAWKSLPEPRRSRQLHIIRMKIKEDPLKGPADVWTRCKGYRNKMQEHFIVFTLDASHRVINRHLISIGTLTESLVHPREVFRPAIIDYAAAIVVAHNHPSGDPMPSREDKQVTIRLRAAGKIIGIPMLDHIVVTKETWQRVKTLEGV